MSCASYKPGCGTEPLLKEYKLYNVAWTIAVRQFAHINYTSIDGISCHKIGINIKRLKYKSNLHVCFSHASSSFGICSKDKIGAEVGGDMLKCLNE